MASLLGKRLDPNNSIPLGSLIQLKGVFITDPNSTLKASTLLRVSWMPPMDITLVHSMSTVTIGINLHQCTVISLLVQLLHHLDRDIRYLIRTIYRKLKWILMLSLLSIRSHHIPPHQHILKHLINYLKIALERTTNVQGKRPLLRHVLSFLTMKYYHFHLKMPLDLHNFLLM